MGMPGEAWILEPPEQMTRLHRVYLQTGSQIIYTSTFGGRPARLKAAWLHVQVPDINHRDAEWARRYVKLDPRIVGAGCGS